MLYIFIYICHPALENCLPFSAESLLTSMVLFRTLMANASAVFKVISPSL